VPGTEQRFFPEHVPPDIPDLTTSGRHSVHAPLVTTIIPNEAVRYNLMDALFERTKRWCITAPVQTVEHAIALELLCVWRGLRALD
jgi:hypothetical protein